MKTKILLTLLGILLLTISNGTVQGQDADKVEAAKEEIVTSATKTVRAVEAAPVESQGTIVPPLEEQLMLERSFKTIEGEQAALDYSVAARNATRLDATFLSQEKPTATIVRTVGTPEGEYKVARRVAQYDIRTAVEKGQLRVNTNDVAIQCKIAVWKLVEAGEITEEQAKKYLLCCQKTLADFYGREVDSVVGTIRDIPEEKLVAERAKVAILEQAKETELAKAKEETIEAELAQANTQKEAILAEAEKVEVAVAKPEAEKVRLEQAVTSDRIYFHNYADRTRYLNGGTDQEIVLQRGIEEEKLEANADTTPLRIVRVNQDGIRQANLSNGTQQEIQLLAMQQEAQAAEEDVKETRSFAYLDGDYELANAIRKEQLSKEISNQVRVRYVDTDNKMDDLWKLIACCAQQEAEQPEVDDFEKKIDDSLKRAKDSSTTETELQREEERRKLEEYEKALAEKKVEGTVDQRRYLTHMDERDIWLRKTREVVCDEEPKKEPEPEPTSPEATPPVVPTAPVRAEVCVHFAQHDKVLCPDGWVDLDPSAESEYSVTSNPWFMGDWKHKEDYECYQQINEIYRKAHNDKISATEAHEQMAICFNQLMKRWLKGKAGLLTAFTTNVKPEDVAAGGQRHAAALALDPSDVSEVEDSTGQKFFTFNPTRLSALSDGTQAASDPRITLRIDQPSLTAGGGCSGGSLTTHRSDRTQPMTLLLLMIALITLGVGQLVHRLRRVAVKR